MIYSNVLNHMDEDELRNYICHLSALNDRYQRYVNILASALDKYIELLCINNEVYRCDSDVVSKKEKVYALEKEIHEKYKDYYVPIPKNSCASVKGEA